MPKMQDYTLATNLNDNYIFLGEDGSSIENPTLKIPLSLLKTFLGGTEINEWVASTAYVIGDIVINSNNLYKCKTAHTSGETFDIVNWDCISTGTLTSISWNDVLSKPFNSLGTDLSVTDNVLSVAKVNGHTVETDVPVNAVFTDTTYNVFTTTVNGLVPFPTTSTGNFLKDDGTWAIAQGEKGDNAYVWIKYSAIQPTQDSDIGDTPNEWLGIYSGASATAPTTYTSYSWYKTKGENGDSGTDGSHIYYGIACTGTSETGVVFTTGITNANIDDTYINTSTSNLYRCNLGGNDTTATWVYVNSLKGADGTVQINDTSTNSTTETWSVNKINSTKQDKITISSTLTLTVAGWDSGTKTQKALISLSTSNVNSIIYDLSSLDMVIASGIIPSLEEATGITFKCTTIPTSDINFKVKVTVI